MKGAADEMSPGTTTRCSAMRSAGQTETLAARRSTRTPAAASMRSVWSRVGVGSTTVVGPLSANRPASSTHDLTCAEATGSSYVIGCSGRPPSTSSGGLPSLSSQITPMRRSGVTTRSTGRRRIDSSPSSVNVPGWPARMPESSRSSVPALCTSIGPSGGCSPRRPTPCTRRFVRASSSHSTRAPIDSTAATRGQRVGVRAEALDLDGPVGERAEQHGAVATPTCRRAA